MRLDPDHEAPGTRPGGDFRHHPLLPWAMLSRGELLAAVLTLVRAWVAEGRPHPKGVAMGSFDEWVHTVGGILAVAGVDGFLANAREVLEQSDPDVDAWWGLLALARSHLPHYWTAADLAAEVEAAGLGGDELPADFGETDRPGFASRVAYALRKKCGRRFGSCRLNRAADPSRHARYWIEVTGSEPPEDFPW